MLIHIGLPRSRSLFYWAPRSTRVNEPHLYGIGKKVPLHLVVVHNKKKKNNNNDNSGINRLCWSSRSPHMMMMMLMMLLLYIPRCFAHFFTFIVYDDTNHKNKNLLQITMCSMTMMMMMMVSGKTIGKGSANHEYYIISTTGTHITAHVICQVIIPMASEREISYSSSAQHQFQSLLLDLKGITCISLDHSETFVHLSV